MRSREAFFTHFNSYPVFSKQDLRILAQKLEIPDTTLDSYIQRSIADKTVVSLKRNYYVTSDFYDDHGAKTNYRFYISNYLLSPSYISKESALQYYGLLAESVENYFTAVTSSLTRKFDNRMGVFEYSRIKQKLFTDFSPVEFEVDDLRPSFLIASKSKAVFDYLYYRNVGVIDREEMLIEVLNEYRIDTDELTKKEMSSIIKLFKSV